MRELTPLSKMVGKFVLGALLILNLIADGFPFLVVERAPTFRTLAVRAVPQNATQEQIARARESENRNNNTTGGHTTGTNHIGLIANVILALALTWVSVLIVNCMEKSRSHLDSTGQDDPIPSSPGADLALLLSAFTVLALTIVLLEGIPFAYVNHKSEFRQPTNNAYSTISNGEFHREWYSHEFGKASPRGMVQYDHSALAIDGFIALLASFLITRWFSSMTATDRPVSPTETPLLTALE